MPRDSSDPGTFAALLRQHRIAANLTQEALAEHAGLSARAISELERGRHRRPHPDTLSRLLAALQLTGPVRRSFLDAAHEPSPARLPPARPSAVLQPSLRLPRTPLIGREVERTALTTLLQQADVPLVTLSGPGGVGKTRLALQVASDLDGVFPDGVCVIDLAPLAEAALVPTAMAAALGVREAGGRPAVALLTSFLRGKRLLLLLDNFEHVLAAAPMVGMLLGDCPAVTALVTSRAPLRLREERMYTLSPLTVPNQCSPVSVEQLMQNDAVCLFMDRAHTICPGMNVTPANAAAIGEICRRLDGLPLAIELAAARSNAFPPQALLEGLENRLQLLTLSPRDVPDRQRTLRNTLTWSHDLLSPAEQALFRRTGIFAGGFTLAAARAVANPAGEFDELAAVTRLVDLNLLYRPETAVDVARYRMLETVREFSLELLNGSGETAAVRQLHADYFVDLAEHLLPATQGPDTDSLTTLAQERDNFRVAHAWLEVAEDWEQTYRLLRSLHWLWRVHGPVSEYAQWMERALSHAAGIAPALSAEVHCRAGDVTNVGGNPGHARTLLRESLALARDSGDDVALAWALAFSGIDALRHGEDHRAEQLDREALAIARGNGHQFLEASMLDNLGVIARRRGDAGCAIQLYEESLNISEAMSYEWSSATVLGHLADALTELEDFARAITLYRESVRRLSALGERRNLLGTLSGVALLLAVRGRQRDAMQLCGAISAALEELGVVHSTAGQVGFERAIAEAAAILDEADIADAIATGRTRDVDGTLAWADAALFELVNDTVSTERGSPLIGV